MPALKVKCNQCSAEFESALTVRSDGHGGEIQEFTCPTCGHLYPVARITMRGVRLREKLAKLRQVPGAEEQVKRTLEAYKREVTRLTE